MLAKAIVEAVSQYEEPDIVVEVSKGLGEAMKGIEIAEIPQKEKLQTRGI